MHLGPKKTSFRKKHVKLINIATLAASLGALGGCIGPIKAGALIPLAHSLEHSTWYSESTWCHFTTSS